MADHIWVSTNGDWSSTSSWHDGAVPAAGDRALLLTGSQSVTAGLNQSAVDNLTVVLDEDYHGSVGSSGSPLQGGTGWTVALEARNAPEVHLDLGDSFEVHVLSTSANANALVLDGGGSSAKAYIRAAHTVTLAASLTLDELYLLTAAARARLLSGLTLGDAHVDGGLVFCDAAVTNIHMREGHWIHQGTNTHDVTMLEVHGGTFELAGCTGAVISVAKVFGGTVDARRDKTTKTITAAAVYPRGALLLDNGADTITATVTRIGGLVTGGSNVTVNETVPYLGLR